MDENKEIRKCEIVLMGLDGIDDGDSLFIFFRKA